MTNEEYYEYHESKSSLMQGQVTDYFHCSVCDKDRMDEDMSEEKDVCKDCFNEDKGTVSLECRCGRKYWATVAYAKKVEEGKVENLCGQCDKSNEED